MANHRALVVEDSRTIACVMKHYLQLEGFEVLLAANGEIGLETARREHPGVIVTDLNMPGMGGLDMVRALRADASTQDIAICMVTSDERADGERDARAVGAAGFMGLAGLGTLAHSGESVLSDLRDGALRFTPLLATALLALSDCIRTVLSHLDRTGHEGDIDGSAIIDELVRLQSATAQNDE